jgi:hypothetical protein
MKYFLFAKDHPESPGTCSSCGGQIGENDSRSAQRICLICRARLLNEHFQEVRVGKSSNEGTELPPRS